MLFDYDIISRDEYSYEFIMEQLIRKNINLLGSGLTN
jgi:hypothetical protein